VTTVADPRATLTARAAAIGDSVLEEHADDVDAASRFPVEGIAALRDAELLSVMVPTARGGAGATLSETSAAVTALGRHCASTAMIYAMHLIQVACLIRHGSTPDLEDFLRSVVDDQLLLASATTEVGIGGDVRSSGCAVELDGGRFALRKQAPVISYGEYADAVLATARRTADSPPNDQVLVVCPRDSLTLQPVSEWDVLGFRGTCSQGFVLDATGPAGLVFTDPYGDISSATMLPVSHVLWASLWLGIAARAHDKARRYVQAAARSKPGTTPPGALRLAEMTSVLTQFEALVAHSARRWEAIADDPGALSSISSAVAMNTLKVSASTLVVDIVHRAMAVCGMAGYSNTSPYSLGRLLRDAHGAALMVNNDRVLANTAQLLLAHRDG
jgi:acyl-CoA dehydrogenase